MNDAGPLVVTGIFILVYAGMILGRLPWLQLDRTGVALLGAIAVMAAGGLSLDAAADAVDIPTLAILFAFMVVSAQLRLGGFFGWLTRRLAALPLGHGGFLAGVIVAVAALSAVFSNDIVCLAVAPVLVEVCRRRDLPPVPSLLALACAANIGSAATLIGNPQNILVGAALDLDFADYSRTALLPTLLALVITWVAVMAASGWLTRAPVRTAPAEVRRPRASVLYEERLVPDPPLDRWQSFKGLAVGGVLLLIFLFTGLPRDLCALAGAGLLLLSRRLHSREVLGLVDWQLLVLFVALFVVNGALQATPVPAGVLERLADYGVVVSDRGWLFVVTAVLSNLVSNVPAIMLLLPAVATPADGAILALASTLAGNLFIVSSIANIIVVESAARLGVPVSWQTHAVVGVPTGIASLAVAAFCVL